MDVVPRRPEDDANDIQFNKGGYRKMNLRKICYKRDGGCDVQVPKDDDGGDGTTGFN